MLSIPPANSNRAHPPTWWIPGRKSGRTPCNPSISVLVVAVNGAQVQGHVRERERVRETGRERKRGRERERERERENIESAYDSLSRVRDQPTVRLVRRRTHPVSVPSTVFRPGPANEALSPLLEARREGWQHIYIRH